MTSVSERLSIAFQGDKTLAEYAELAALVERYGFGTISVYGDLMWFEYPFATNAGRKLVAIAWRPPCAGYYVLYGG